MAHTLCVLDTKGLCFCTATVIAGTRLHVTLYSTYVACLLVLLSTNTLLSSLFLSTLRPYSFPLERGRSGLRQLWDHCEISLGTLPTCAKRKGQRRKSSVIIYTPNAFHTKFEIRTAFSGPSRAVGTHTALQTVITFNRPRRDKLSHSYVIWLTPKSRALLDKPFFRQVVKKFLVFWTL
jgi:hypothetical protein